MSADENKGEYRGVSSAVAAYVWWGVSPIFFVLLKHIESFEIIAHRVLWTLFFLSIIKALGYGRNVLRKNLFDLKKALPFLLSMLCIVANWLLFTWAVTHGHVLETSLGYFINPLFSVLAGVLLLKEKLRPWQTASVLLATAGVLQMILRLGVLPWIALALAISWCIYGVIRKQAKIDAMNGLTIELVFASPFAIGYLLWKSSEGTLDYSFDNTYDLFLLVSSGFVTMVPLLLFGYAARRMSLTSLGILQYFAPTLSFCVAVFLFNEPFDQVKLLAFGCIWVALAIYTIDMVRTSRRQHALTPLPVE